ncbi:MAG: hypothetical protein K2G83_02480 [Ruminococcus sp.]|nr:hypothetical protein [Ruminococcus sp.]
MKITIKLNQQKIRDIENVVKESAVEAIESVHVDLVESETMPFDAGDMQNNQTFVAVEGDDTINEKDIYLVSIVTGSPQARRLYYHPEYNFQTGKNTNAGAYWLDPYINGNKKDLVKVKFMEAFKRRIGV